MSHRQQKRDREPWRDNPDWEPSFNDPELQRAYEKSRDVIDAHRDRATWGDSTNEKGQIP